MTKIIDDTRILQDQNLCNISYDDIIKANGEKPYTMSLTDKGAIKAVIDAVNQGIDSRLQACSFEGKDSYVVGQIKVGDLILANTLECTISPESLPVLIRRLFEANAYDEEHDVDHAESLAEDILTSLGFDLSGKFVGRDE